MMKAMWLGLCAPSMVLAQAHTESSDERVTAAAVVKVAPPALSPPVLNIKVDTKRADFAKHERCELLIVPATPAAKLVMRGVVTGETPARTYDYGYRFGYDLMGFYSPYRELGRRYGIVLQRKNAQTQRCRRLEKWLHQHAPSMLNVPASFPVVRLPEL